MKSTTTYLWLLLAASLLALPMQAQTIRYVKAGATGDGSSWAAASGDLQAIINASNTNDQVWVAQGVYKPTSGNDRTISFSMKNELRIYGGFPTSGNPTLDNRNPASLTTVLSGDIGTLGDKSDNSYHVIYNPPRLDPFFFNLSTTVPGPTILDGFVIRDGNANGGAGYNSGGGVLNTSNITTFYGCWFLNNSASNLGGAICTSTVDISFDGLAHFIPVNALLKNCYFEGNTANRGGALCNDASVDLSQVNPLLINCMFLNNSAADIGGAVYNIASYKSAPTFINCSFLNNSAINAGGAIAGSRTYMRNCVLFGNGGAKTLSIQEGMLVESSYCLYETGVTGYSGGIASHNYATNVSPFVSNSNGRLSPCSSAIEAGNNGALPPEGSEITTDLDGNPRIVNGTVDLGAYEFQGSVLTITSQPMAPSSVCKGTTLRVAVGTSRSDRSDGTYQWYKAGTPGVALSGQTSATLTLPNVQASDMGSYYVVVTSTCISFTSTSFNLSVSISPTRLYVNASAAGDNTGISWNDAFTDLQSALNYSCSGKLTEIWVAQGTYKPGIDRTSSFAMKSGLTIYGGFPPLNNPTFADRNSLLYPTILSGDIGTSGDKSDNSYHVISNVGVDATAILSGFIIRDGNANGLFPYDNGGGLYNDNSSPTLTNCSFLNNAAQYGGAISNNSTSAAPSNPNLINCLFQGNSATQNGGAMYSSLSTPTLTNCSFLGNTANNGGGLYNYDSNVTLTNCSFQANTSASLVGGAIYNFGVNSVINSVLTNCVVFGNGGSQAVYNVNATVSATYSLFETGMTGFSGSNNLTTNASPFASISSNQLSFCTPAINAGTNAAVPGGLSADLDGNPRIVNGTVDMGAYEFQGGASANRLYVRAGATGANTGLNWTDAFPNLQYALNYSGGCPTVSTIWVAAGTYKPTLDTNPAVSFELKPNLAIYGGFVGTENDLSERPAFTPANPSPSMLSGDIGVQGDNSDNSYHVVHATNINSTAILDGFVITNGNARNSFPNYQGGGLHNDGSSPTLNRCAFQANSATYGGGIENSNGSHPTLTNCWFVNNVGQYGGAVQNTGGSTPTLINCSFQANSAQAGGAIMNDGGSPTLINCSFQANTGFGGALANYGNAGPSNPVLTNCVLFNNGGASTFYNGPTQVTLTATYSLFESSVTGYSSSPTNRITNSTPFAFSNDTQLSFNSPAINVGNNAAIPNGVSTDLSGYARITDGTVDIGAYENHFVVNPPVTTNNALNFDGKNDYVLIDNTSGPIVTGSDAITVEYWFKGTNSQSAVRLQPNDENYIVTAWHNAFHILSNDGGTDNGLPVGTGFADGNWHHIAFTWQRNTPNGFKSYLDGQLVAQRQSSDNPLPNITSGMGLGAYIQGGREFTSGSLDEVRIWSVVRSQVQIQTGTCEQSVSASEPGLLVYYQFNQGVAGGSNLNVNTLGNSTDAYRFRGLLTNFGLAGGSSNWVTGYPESSPISIATEPPALLAVCPTGTATLTVSVTGFVIGYQWFKDGVALSGQNSSILTLSNVQPSDQGRYWVVLTGNCTSLTSTGTNLKLLSNRLYVNANATGANTGISWDNAFTDLQSALNYNSTCIPITEIWVAAGMYKPSTDRKVSFAMRPKVAMYGGFIGNELTLSERPLVNPITGQPSSATLSGEIGNPLDPSDNSQHVVIAPSGLDNTAILDGFVITGGVGVFVTDGGGNGSYGGGMLNLNSSPTVRNCSFQQNYGDLGGAMTNFGQNGTASPVLANCLFQNNSSGLGGAIFNLAEDGNVSPVLTNCIFLTNFSYYIGGAMFNSGANSTLSPALTNCSFVGNSAMSGGGGIYNDGLYGQVNPSPNLTNCSFVNNSAPQGGAMFNAYSSPQLTNSVVFGNGGSNTFVNDTHSTLTARYSLFESTVSGYISDPTNLTTTISPFVSTSNPQLVAGSPAIDGGTSSAPGLVGISTDLAGNPRIVGSQVDMGAYEFQTPGSLQLITSATPNPVCVGSPVALSVTASGGATGMPATPYSYTWAAPVGVTLSATNTAAISATLTVPGVQTFTVSVAGSGGAVFTTTLSVTATASPQVSIAANPSLTIAQGASTQLTASGGATSYSWSSGETSAAISVSVAGTYSVTGTAGSCTSVASVTVVRTSIPCGAMVYVTPTGAGLQNGISWDNAFAGTDLQTAINTAVSCGAQVWVAQGTYKPTATSTDRTASFSVTTGIALYGGFPSTGNPTFADRNPTSFSTILSGDIDNDNSLSGNSYHVLRISGSASSRIDGFAITGGNANGTFPDERGGGIYTNHTSPLLANCTFTSNSASYGGGLFNDGNGAGGVASPTLINCLFTTNTSTNAGGGIYNYADNGGLSSPQLINCEFQFNSALNGGGALYNNGTAGTSSPNLINCSFQGNASPQGSVLFSYGENGGQVSPILINCVVFNNGTTNVFYNDAATVTASYSLFDQSSLISQPTNRTTSTSPFVSTTSTQLSACSPAINAGSNAAYNALTNPPATDLAGNPRFYNGGQVDMGAYEFQGNPTSLPVSNPAITTAILNQPFSQSFTASGGSPGSPDRPYSFSLASGSLPTGLSLNLNGQLSGSPTQTGSFTLTVSVTDAAGCSGSGAPYVLTVSDATLTISAFAANLAAVCVGSPVTFTATIGNVSGSYAYTLTGGSSLITGSASGSVFSQSLTASGTGSQGYSLIINSSGQSSPGQSTSASTSLTVNALPMATLSASPSTTLTCAQTSLTLTAGGGSAYMFSPNVLSQSGNTAVVNAAGLYSVKVVSGTGCFSTTSLTISSDASTPTPTLSASPSTTLTCAQTSLTLTAGGGTSYVFSPNVVSQSGNTAVVNTSGVYSVTALSANGCSAVASTTITSNTTLEAPSLVTQSGHPYPGGVHSLTTTQNTVDVILMVSGCANGTITWSGGNSSTLSVSTINTGIQTFTASCSQSSCISPIATATITVVAPTLTVYSRDPDNGQLSTNTLKPYLQLQNDGNTPIPYREITVRYWLTVENPAPLRFDINYAQMGNDNVHLTYVPLSSARQGATGYIEFSFDGSAGSLAGGSNAVIQDLVNKQDYSYFFQGDDYSYANNPNFAANPHITAYRNAVLIYGVEPAVIGGPVTSLSLTASTNPTTLLTTGSIQLQANVSGGTPGYMYTFNGPGTIQPSGNTASVSGLPAGVQTFTVTARDATSPVNQTIATTVSVTVTAPANQTPVASANSNQTATVGQPFSYVVGAFSDDTPNSLTYAASINPANGFTFSPVTRVVQGTPTSTGVSSVTVTATDPPGLSASTIFTITVSPAPPAPTALTLTASASPTIILTTSSTQLLANVSGGTPGYMYTFNGPGTIQPSGNTASVLGLPTGVQTFTVTARDATSPVNQTIATTVSVTVTAPANQTPVASANSNQTATVGQPFSYVVGAFSDDTPNSLTYTASINPANGLTFNPVTRVIQGMPQNTGVSSVTITATDPGGLSASTVFTIIVNAAPVVTDRLTVLSRDPDNGQLSTNTLKPYLQLQNDGNTPIPYREITVRYWLTVENPAPLRFDINYAQMGNDNVHLTYVPLSLARQGATGYIEFSFDGSAGSLAGGSNAVIQDLVNKQDYSYFFQGDDYSYVNNPNFAANPRITAYRNAVLVYGSEPPAGARQGAEQADVPLQVRVLGNPVQGSELSVEVSGAEGQPLHFQLIDLQGRVVTDRLVDVAGPVEQQRLALGHGASSLLLLQVSTPSQRQTVKVIREN